jgi:hypothetical protein
MQTHICDMGDMEIHCCCGGFVWPDTVKAYCGRGFRFRQPEAASLDREDSSFCSECLRRYRQDAGRTRSNVFVIRE